MTIFLVVPTENPDGISSAIHQHFEQDSYPLPRGEWLVSFKGTTKELSEKLDLCADRPGVVVAIQYYWGYTSNDVWEWIAVKEKAG